MSRHNGILASTDMDDTGRQLRALLHPRHYVCVVPEVGTAEDGKFLAHFFEVHSNMNAKDLSGMFRTLAEKFEDQTVSGSIQIMKDEA